MTASVELILETRLLGVLSRCVRERLVDLCEPCRCFGDFVSESFPLLCREGEGCVLVEHAVADLVLVTRQGRSLLGEVEEVSDAGGVGGVSATSIVRRILDL